MTNSGPDGYPPEWHATIKHAVREAAGNRCVRCGHPYTKGDGEWSLCGGSECTHGAPYRLIVPGMGGISVVCDEPGSRASNNGGQADKGVRVAATHAAVPCRFAYRVLDRGVPFGRVAVRS